MRIAVVLGLCVALVFAAPEPHKRITYEYVGETETASWVKLTSQMSSAEKSGFRIKSDIILTILPYEKRQLEMKNVRVEEKSPKDKDFTTSTTQSDFKTALEKHHIEFSDLNGHVTTLKTPPDEPKWVNDIKRGVVSALQVHYQEDYADQSSKEKSNGYEYRVPEVDVTGDCVVNYTAKQNDGDDLFQVTLIKTKDPKECTKHTSKVNCTLPGRNCQAMPEKFTSASTTVITMAVLDAPSDIYSNKVIKDVKLEEYYLFDHEIDRDGGLLLTTNTTVRQTLKLVNAEPIFSMLAERPDWRAHTLTAEPVTEVEPQANVDPEPISFPKFDKLMTEYIREIKHGRYPNVEEPALFVNLVTTLRKSNVSTLLHIYEKYSRADKTSRDAFSEVLSSQDTSVAVKLMADQIVSGMVDDGQARRYLRGIAIATNPTREMVNDVLTIARTKPSLRDQCLLALGSMIHSFITNYEVDENAMPNDIEEAKDFLVSFFTKSLKDNNEVEILMGIKGLMNTGLSSTLPLMMQCARECPTLETRATAIFSPWKVSADKITTKVLNELSVFFENMTNPIEIRVAAFIMLMEMKPSMDIVNRISPTLKKETDEDMTSYVCSYLDTSKSTYSLFPGQESRIQIYDEVLRRLGHGCPTETNKFNTSYASSQSLGKEAVLDSHVIYDTSSNLPREIKLNLMDMNDVMGFDTHLFEVGLRMEGLDSHLRALKHGSKDRMDSPNDRHNVVREPPSVSSGKQQQDVIKPKLSLYVVILGQEVYFTHKATDEVSKLLSGLQAGKTVFYNETTQIYYSSFVMPTSLGLPLTVQVDKGSRFSFSVDGRLKVEDSQLTTQLNASLWSYVVGNIGVRGHSLSSGLKFNASSGFQHISVNASVLYDPLKFVLQTRLVEASAYSKRFNFTSFLGLRKAGEDDDDKEIAKNVEFGSLHHSSCVDISGYADFDGVCKQIDGANGLDITYQLRSKTKGTKSDTSQDGRETVENRFSGEWKQVLNKENNDACEGKFEPLTKTHVGMRCQSVENYLTCPKLCKSSSYRTINVDFKCFPFQGSSEAGNESAVHLTKATPIPEGCVCDHEDCERGALNVEI